MDAITKLKKVIQNKICCIVSKGRSVESLDNRITQFRSYDICWSTLNQYDYQEDAILGQIGEKFDLLSDCTTVLKKQFETKIRIPRFLNFLERKENNLLMISELTKQECFLDNERGDILEQYKDKIITIDELFSLPTCPKDVWGKPPNSITLLFAFLVAGGAHKIMIFGMDGLVRGERHLQSYYKPHIISKERMDTYGDLRGGSLLTDTADFNGRFGGILQIYKQAFHNPYIEIVNCNPNSHINIFRKINYSQAIGELDRWNRELKSPRL